MENINTKPEAKEKISAAAEVAQKLFFMWNEALSKGNAEEVADLYSDPVSFLPTMSPKLVTDRNGVIEYFRHFLQRFPTGEVTESYAEYMGDNHLQHSGMYTFTVGSTDARTEIRARFTYTWANIDGQWKITHHHSSLLPA